MTAADGGAAVFFVAEADAESVDGVADFPCAGLAAADGAASGVTLGDVSGRVAELLDGDPSGTGGGIVIVEAGDAAASADALPGAVSCAHTTALNPQPNIANNAIRASDEIAAARTFVMQPPDA